MANIDTVQYDNLYVDVPPTQMKGVEVNGRLHRNVSKIAGTGQAIGSVIRFCKPPKGARMSSLSRLITEALGAGCTIALGTGITGAGVAAAPACFHAAIDVSAISLTQLDLFAAVDYVWDGETDLIGTVAGAVIANAKSIIMECIYALD